MLSAQYQATSTQLQGLQQLINQNIRDTFGLMGSSTASTQVNSPSTGAMLANGSLPPGTGMRFSANA